MQDSFIRLPRSFFESGYWCQSRTFNDCEAILDIINQVRFEATEHSARIGGREVTWGQAEWPASIRFLAGRWRWSEKRVRVFIASLKKKGIITTNDSQGVNIIHLCDSSLYNSPSIEKGTAEGTALELILNKLQDLGAQQRAQQEVLSEEIGHSKGTKTKNGKNDILPPLPPKGKVEYEWGIVSEDMKPIVEEWLHYKSEKKQSYKPSGFKTFYKKLVEYSNGNPETAKVIIERSMSNNWAGIFELKNNGTTATNQHTNQGSDEHPSDSELLQQSIGTIERLRAERHCREGSLW